MVTMALQTIFSFSGEEMKVGGHEWSASQAYGEVVSTLALETEPTIVFTPKLPYKEEACKARVNSSSSPSSFRSQIPIHEFTKYQSDLSEDL